MSASSTAGTTTLPQWRVASIESSLAAREIVPVLDYLISICMDGYYGYRTAAADVSGPACRDLFTCYSVQRAEMAKELARLVAESGFEPDTHGSFIGLLHREWIDLKSSLTGLRSLDAVLAECARGEQTARKAYAEALRHPLGARAREVVERQHQMIETAYANIQSLRAPELGG